MRREQRTGSNLRHARTSLAPFLERQPAEGRCIVTIGVAKPLPCSTVVGGEKANGHSIQSSQKLEYFTKILRLIMSLHRDILELQLQCEHDDVCSAEELRLADVTSPTDGFRVQPSIKAEITMK
ncbi:hypothetical protein ACJJTC_004256 [Scirpophaga incertulas]